MKHSAIAMLFVCICLFFACEEEVIPKPRAQMRLEYPEGKSISLELDDFSFQYNDLATPSQNSQDAFSLEYPEMNGAIFLSYKKVDDNLSQLIMDAKRLSYEHAVKADNIVEQPYQNPEKKVYGSLFEVQGNAASQSQFFVTDSTRHFLTGSVYFYAKPNYDSILPAAAYLQNDIRRLIETLEWK